MLQSEECRKLLGLTELEGRIGLLAIPLALHAGGYRNIDLIFNEEAEFECLFGLWVKHTRQTRELNQAHRTRLPTFRFFDWLCREWADSAELLWTIQMYLKYKLPLEHPKRPGGMTMAFWAENAGRFKQLALVEKWRAA